MSHLRNFARRDGNGTVPDTGEAGVPRLRLRAPLAGSSPVSGSSIRRFAKPLPLAGLLLTLLALIGYVAVYEAGRQHTTVLIAAHSLPAGTVIGEGDLRSGQLAGDHTVLAALVPAGERSQILGQRLSVGVPAGVPLPAAGFSEHQSPTSTMTLDIPEFDVTGIGLSAGDRVTVLATYGAGSGSASTRPIARDLEVLSVGEPAANADPATTTVPVAVAVANPSDASTLALANEDAKLDLLLEGHGALTAAIPSASQGGGVP
jgi:Flp pilus assembly protein CpaB